MLMLDQVRYFGPYYEAIAVDREGLIPVPVNETCIWCEEKFGPSDSGVRMVFLGVTTDNAYYHKNCILRSVIGSLGHITGKCSCVGGTEEDPPHLTKRQAADAAVEEFDRRELERAFVWLEGQLAMAKIPITYDFKVTLDTGATMKVIASGDDFRWIFESKHKSRNELDVVEAILDTTLVVDYDKGILTDKLSLSVHIIILDRLEKKYLAGADVSPGAKTYVEFTYEKQERGIYRLVEGQIGARPRQRFDGKQEGLIKVVDLPSQSPTRSSATTASIAFPSWAPTTASASSGSLRRLPETYRSSRQSLLSGRWCRHDDT